MGGRSKIMAALCIAALMVAAASAVVFAKVYLDIISAPRKLPIAVQELKGPLGAEIMKTVADDLAYSGLFIPLDAKAFTEPPGEGFNSAKWKSTGAELVVKGTIALTADAVEARVFLFDPFEDKAVFSQTYKAPRHMLRQTGHSIAADIYGHATGREGFFKSRIAFISKINGLSELRIADWDGGNGRVVRRAPMILAPHFSPDGSSMIYTSRENGGWGIWIYNVKTGKEKLLIESDGGILMAGDFFPNGREFAFSWSKEGSADIYVYDTGSNLHHRITSELGIEVSPVISPDGATIAYVSDRGGNPQIYTMDRFGYNRTRVTFEGKYNTSPAWSPKGDALAYSGSFEGRHHIFTIRPDGNGLVKLTSEGNNEEPSFSPDGRLIAFSSDRGGVKGIYIMRAGGNGGNLADSGGNEPGNGQNNGLRLISPPGVASSAARWSPAEEFRQ